MRFRRFIVPFILMLTAMFVWNLACSWKKNRLEAEALSELENYDGEYIPHNQIEEYLLNKYDKDRPVWEFPFIGKVTYAALNRDSVSKGPDMLGGRKTTLAVDERDFLLRHANTSTSMLATFEKVLDKTDEVYKASSGSSYIETFISQLKEKASGPLHAYFDSSIASSKPSESTIISRLQKKLKEAIRDAVPILKKRLDPRGVKGYSLYDGRDGSTLTINAPKVAEDKKLAGYIEKPGALLFGKVLLADKAGPVLTDITNHLKMKKDTIFISNAGGSKTCTISDANYEKYGEKIKSAAKDYLASNQKLFFYEEGKTGYMSVFVVDLARKKGFKIEEASKRKAKGDDLLEKKGGRWLIVFKLDEASHNELARISKSIVGLKNKNYARVLPVVLDDTLLMVPSITKAISPKEDREQVISGLSSQKATDIALQLNSGVLPSKLKKVKSIVVEPTLGKQAQNQAFTAILIALLIILLFVAVYYAVGGLVANVSLLLNLIFILGALARFQAILTLTGIAGIVLTIGMAIDVNVLVFEWIREERRRGETVKSAIRKGYQKVYRLIFDTNTTTFIVAIILSLLGGPDVQGFANTLIIGIIATFITGVVCSQLILELLVRLLGEKRVSFSFSFSDRFLSKTNIDFLGKKKYTYLFSFLFIGGGMMLMYHQGADLSTEYTGGRDYVVRFGSKVDTGDVKSRLEATFENTRKGTKLPKGDLSVRAVSQGDQKNGSSYNVTTNFAVDYRGDDIDVDELVKGGLAETSGSVYKTFDEGAERTLAANEFTFDSKSNIDGRLAQKHARSAFWAVVLALVLMLIYIFFSFRNLGLAIASLVALVHDALALLTCLSIAKLFGVVYTIDPIFITTLLTIIGYSINDTCVIFSHIRGQMKAEKTRDISKVANAAINMTLSRTVITSVTTFIPVFILYCFGGAALELLAFSLLWGILWGTYSSIFMATPMACDLDRLFQKIKKRLKKRKKS